MVAEKLYFEAGLNFLKDGRLTDIPIERLRWIYLYQESWFYEDWYDDFFAIQSLEEYIKLLPKANTQARELDIIQGEAYLNLSIRQVNELQIKQFSILEGILLSLKHPDIMFYPWEQLVTLFDANHQGGISDVLTSESNVHGITYCRVAIKNGRLDHRIEVHIVPKNYIIINKA